MGSVKYGLLHCHTEHSIRDSAMSVKALIARAVEMGAPAVALTDHGTMAGFYEFMQVANKQETKIKPIAGVEAYVFPNRDNDVVNQAGRKDKRHLILMAKDEVGYRAICKAVTESNNFLDYGFPRMDYRLLKERFGEKSIGHGHVIATSACMNGILMEILLHNASIQKEIEKIIVKRDKYAPLSDSFLDMCEKEDEMEREISSLIDRREQLTAESKANLSGLTKALRAMEKMKQQETDEYKEKQKKLEEATAAKEKANADLADIKRLIAKRKTEKTAYSKELKVTKDSVDKWMTQNDLAEEKKKEMKSDKDLYAYALETAKEFEGIFGKGNFFIELQNHGVFEEKRFMPVVAKIAKELSIPVVAANDAHYATKSYEDIRAHTLVRAMRFKDVINGDETSEAGYGELYLKGDDELRTALSFIVDKETVNEAMENVGKIVDMCNLSLEFKEHYPVFVGGNEGETPTERLYRLAKEGIPKRYPNPGDWTPEMEKRLDYEMSVISGCGYSDYLCIVQDFLAYGRSLATDNPYGVGYTIGPGRGSAVGSLVCYLSGITSIDPIRHGLLFERFLNTERVSMPDIDSDFATWIRATVLDYVKNKYGQNAVCNILTKGTMAGKSAIRNVGRITGVADEIVDTVARMIPAIPDAKIADASAELEAYCKVTPAAARLIEDAKIVEGCIVNYGMHAAGVIIADTKHVSDYVALMYNGEKGQWVAQCDMGQCEKEAGLLKMDFLGLRNLDIIDDTLKRIKQNTGKSIDIEKVPFEQDVFNNIFAAGMTNSVFQFESSGMKEMLKKFRPTSIDDIILLVAAYRPGPMQFLDEIISNKHGRSTPTYIADGLEPILKNTYGKPIYQEQVMQIFNKVAGFSLGEADIIRRAMGKKKLSILTDPKTDYHGKFIKGLVDAGASNKEAEEFWDSLLDFASYAFNKSHAAAYAYVAYYTAYLKYYYPAEYMSSVMMRVDLNKLPALLGDCRTMGLKTKQPDANMSDVNFVNRDDVILFGFNNVKGVGNVGEVIVNERKANGPYRSVKDFVKRLSESGINKTAYESLIKSGAFDQFCNGNRTSVMNVINDLIDVEKKIISKEQELKGRQQVLDDLKANPKSTEKDLKKAEQAVASSQKSLTGYQQTASNIEFIPVEESQRCKLEDERKLLGFYVSGHPLDVFDEAIAEVKGAVPIAALEDSGRFTICGIVENLRIVQRKKDGVPLCFFNLMDKTDSIEVRCFTTPYAKFGHLINEGAVLTVSGKMMVQKSADEDGNEVTIDRGISVDNLEMLHVKEKDVLVISINTFADWTDAYRELKPYIDPNGCSCVCNDLLWKTVRECNFRLSKEALNVPHPKCVISIM